MSLQAPRSRGAALGRRGAPSRSSSGLAGRAARLTGGLDRVSATLVVEPVVERLDRLEDNVGGRLGLLAGRVLDLLEDDRVAVLDGDLRDLESLPVAHIGRAGDRGRHDRRAALERDPADAG